ncbi:hypothetical protein EI009_25840, partial [Escherichia coli]|uniref:hypothetical protein n=1 Tax=Escherichia coli TaxID=562 RepID=UPI00128EF21B
MLSYISFHDLKYQSLQTQPLQIGLEGNFCHLNHLLAMVLPFFNDIVGLIGAIGFWPLTVYFP